MTHVPPSLEPLEVLDRVVRLRGDKHIAKILGIDSSTVLRLLAHLPVRTATRVLIEVRLPQLMAELDGPAQP